MLSVHFIHSYFVVLVWECAQPLYTLSAMSVGCCSISWMITFDSKIHQENRILQKFIHLIYFCNVTLTCTLNKYVYGFSAENYL